MKVQCSCVMVDGWSMLWSAGGQNGTCVIAFSRVHGYNVMVARACRGAGYAGPLASAGQARVPPLLDYTPIQSVIHAVPAAADGL